MSRERAEEKSLEEMIGKSYGFSLDLFYGCPTFKETMTTLVVCTCPGYHYGVIQFRKKKSTLRLNVKP